MSQSAKNDFLMILNEEGTIVKADGNTLVPLGMPAPKTIGMLFSEFVVPEEEILTSEMISQVLMTGQSFQHVRACGAREPELSGHVYNPTRPKI